MITLPYEIEKNLVWRDVQAANALVDAVAAGRKPMQLICSPSGFGKTTIAKRSFKQHGIVPEDPLERRAAMRRAVIGEPPFNPPKQIFVETRPDKVISVVRVLFRCALLQAAVLLFDDPGRVASDEAACDVMKTAFGMQRTVSHETPEISRNEERRISGRGSYDPFIPPPDFRLRPDLRWLWLANINFTDPTIIAKLGAHFAALIARGLDPFWIRDDAENDHRDLFLHVHYLATEQNLLRGMGFPYTVSRRAVNFYVTHSQSLVDLCPRRLELIAKAFASDQPPAALDATLATMLAKSDLRPKLKVPESWVSVPNGILLWPDQPFSTLRPRSENNPPRRIRKREQLHKQRQSAPSPPANDGFSR